MDITSVPVIAPGCRVHPTRAVLLVPEGTLELSDSARDILDLVDGKKTVASIVGQLLLDYEGAPEMEVRSDVLALLALMQQRGVVRTRE